MAISTPLINFPFPFTLSGFTDIVPFTERDAMTHQKLLYELIRAMQQLQPELNAELQKIYEDFQAGITNAELHITATEASWEALFKAFMDDVLVRLEALNDQAVSNLVNNINSLLHGALDNNYVAGSTKTEAIYVAPNGNDSNVGSEASPLKTLAKAVSLIPEVVRKNHAFSINLLQGMWAEDIIVRDKIILGTLTLRGTTTDRSLHKVDRVHGWNLLGNVLVENITSTHIGASGNFKFTRCTPLVDIANCNVIGPTTTTTDEGNIGYLADFGTQMRVRYCNVDNMRYGLRSNYLSRIFAADNTGSGNTFGVGARWGGIVNTFGTNPSGVSADKTVDSGGLMVESAGAKVGLPRWSAGGELCLTRQIETVEGRFPVKEWTVRTNNSQVFNNPIPVGKKMRLYFRNGTANGAVLIIKAQMQYVPIATSTPRYVNAVFGGTLGESSLTGFSQQVVSGSFGSGNRPEDMLTVTHKGSDNEFYIDMVPGAVEGARAGWYGMDVEISNVRDYSAPVLFDAKII